VALTDRAIRNAKSDDKARKMYDLRGLYLLINPKGGRWWRFRYRFMRKERLLSLGTYPEVSLSEARERCEEARRLVRRGLDPSAERKAAKAALEGAARREHDYFESVAREWFEKFRGAWTENHATTLIGRLERDVFPWLGARPVKEITAVELLEVLRRIEARGALETAHRVNQICGQVFRFGIATGRATLNPTTELRGALAPVKEEHHAALTRPADVAGLMRAINAYKGSFVVRCALRFAALTFQRPGEIRSADWDEIELDGRLWRISAERMKGRREHLVPLSRQAVAILRELHPLTGSGRYVFPGRTASRPMSENAVLAALRRMGYSHDEMTGHGFRRSASTLLNESGKWNADAIERQLAHVESNEVRAAYNAAEYLDERRAMMQWWADHLDCLTDLATVVKGEGEASRQSCEA
jgi:integrase